MDDTSAKREIKDEISAIEMRGCQVVQKNNERYSTLEFGCHLVPCADAAGVVYSDYCTHAAPRDTAR